MICWIITGVCQADGANEGDREDSCYDTNNKNDRICSVIKRDHTKSDLAY
jgi:hypothetical protein